MTLSELLNFYPGTQASDWHQHNLGGGWIYKDAYADITAYVGPNAIVAGYARVYGNARVSGNAQVFGNAIVKDYAWIRGYAVVEENAYVGGNAVVEDHAWIGGNAIINGMMTITSGQHIGFDITNLDLAYCLGI